jgi:hypothetical protein
MSSRRLLLLIGSTLAAAIIGAFLMRGANQGLWLPLSISIGSLIVSLLGAFKSDFFSFAPRMRDGEAMLVFVGRDADSKTVLSTLVVRLHFLNAGYADEIVRDVSLEVMQMSNGTKAKLHPVLELEMKTLFHATGRGLHADHTLGPFVSFVIPAKVAIAKTFLFVSDAPALNLSEGAYRFDVSGTSSRGSMRRHRFERAISSANITDYQSGGKIFLEEKLRRVNAAIRERFE